MFSHSLFLRNINRPLKEELLILSLSSSFRPKGRLTGNSTGDVRQHFSPEIGVS